MRGVRLAGRERVRGAQSRKRAQMLGSQNADLTPFLLAHALPPSPVWSGGSDCLAMRASLVLLTQPLSGPPGAKAAPPPPASEPRKCTRHPPVHALNDDDDR